MTRLRALPLSLVAASALVLGLPVASLSGGGPGPEPVAADVWAIDVPVAPEGAGATADLERTSTAPFSMVAVTWERGSAQRVAVEARAQSGGVWGEWTSLGETDSFADRGSQDSDLSRAVTSPLWVGPSTGVQVRVASAEGRPRDLQVELIDPGTSPHDRLLGAPAAPISTAAAADDGRPAIITRAQWGADESIRLAECPNGPSYTGAPKVGFVHHTASGNDYTLDTAAAAVRGIYAYSVNSRGYCDIPYNFLVDKFGRIFEGRFGGIDSTVLSAATGGFNANTFAVSALGTYSTVAPSAAQVEAIATMVGWKLGRYAANPLGSAQLTAAGGAGTTSRYPDGTTVTVPVVSGHRQVGATECPGNTLFPFLDQIRQRAAEVAAATPPKPASAESRAFVAALYADYLGRSADLAELDYWAEAIFRGVLTRAQTAAAFSSSPEWTRARIDALYREVLGRPGDPAGIAYWAGRLSGQPGLLATLTAEFLASPERFAAAGGSNAAWVGSVYESVLGRAPDTGGLASWSAAAAASGRTPVAYALVQSPESLSRRIDAVYRLMLKRQADPVGLVAWAPTVQIAGDIVLSNALAASTEYGTAAEARFP